MQRPRRERSVAWPPPPTIHPPQSCPNYGARTLSRPMFMTEPFDGKPAAMPAGSDAWFCYGPGQCTTSGGSPVKPHTYLLCMRACSVYLSIALSEPLPRVGSSFGVGSGTARRYLQSSP